MKYDRNMSIYQKIYIHFLYYFFEYIYWEYSTVPQWAKIWKKGNLELPHCLLQRLKSMFFGEKIQMTQSQSKKKTFKKR